MAFLSQEAPPPRIHFIARWRALLTGHFMAALDTCAMLSISAVHRATQGAFR